MDDVVKSTFAVVEHFGISELFEDIPIVLACCAVSEGQ